MSLQSEIDDSGTSSDPAPNSLPLIRSVIETRTLSIGQQIFTLSRGSFWSSIWRKNFWMEKLMELTTRDPKVKTQLFRFVDVLPVLKTQRQKEAHLREYLAAPAEASLAATRWPWILRLTTALLGLAGMRSIIVAIADIQVRQMARNFILGHDFESAKDRLRLRRNEKIAFTLDVLGEAVLSEDEAEHYQRKYHQLISGLKSASFPEIPQIDESALGKVPAVNLSIKISSLDSRIDPAAFEWSLDRLELRLLPILREAMAAGIFINFDMEQYAFKDLIRALFKRLLFHPEFRSYRHLGIVVQAYLESSRPDVADWIAVARQRGTPFSIRLVKGAYWDYENIVADQNGWISPVFQKKIQSDQNFEACTEDLLRAYPALELAVASHNVRSIAHAMAVAEALGLKKNAFEFQMLYGMAAPFKKALVQMGFRLREYDPIGEMLPGLSYLVRRLLENTSNDSFLKQSFMDRTGIHDLLKAPKT